MHPGRGLWGFGGLGTSKIGLGTSNKKETAKVSFLLLVLELEVLYVDRLLLGDSLLHGRLLEVLAGAEFADGAGLLEFPLEFLEGSLNVFAFLDLYDNHAFTPPFSLGMQR